MFKKISNRTFFIFASILLITIMFSKNPYFKSKKSSTYRQELFNNLILSLKEDSFNPEEYWEFRERYSPGSFLRDEDHTDFFATFKITKVSDKLTPLFYYESELIRSVDGVISFDAKTAIELTKNKFPGEIISENDKNILIKSVDNQYILVFVESTQQMRKVMGTFDYKSDERELLEDKYWYNATYINLK